MEECLSRIMIGYHGTSVIADAFAKGVQGFNKKLALEAMLNASNEDKKEINDYKTLGYVAHDYRSRGYRESASMTLEYSYDDWTIYKFIEDLKASSLSKLKSDFDLDKLASIYKERSQSYRNIFDTETGFFRPRLKDGSFMTPFDPRLLTHRQNGFTEANAWQYLWSVPHDIEALIELLGGDIAFSAKLEQLFKGSVVGKAPDVTGMIGAYAHGNEPGHHIPYLFNYVGKAHRTQYWLRRIMREMYSRHLQCYSRQRVLRAWISTLQKDDCKLRKRQLTRSYCPR